MGGLRRCRDPIDRETKETNEDGSKSGEVLHGHSRRKLIWFGIYIKGIFTKAQGTAS
jgi:hypothetical protein